MVMKRVILDVFVAIVLLSCFAVPLRADESGTGTKQGAYLVVEGRVTVLTTRSLTIDDKQYPISTFVRVYNNDTEKGAEIPMRTIVNIGKIDKARIYLIDGKVEKIIILLNI
jgi:hypothetical protein